MSAVVPSYNSAKTVLRCIDSIKNQTSPCKEIVVVDRFSTDQTASLAKSRGVRLIQADVNRSVARNIGARTCTSSGLMFIDSDMILPPRLAEECKAGLKRYDALVIPERSVGSGFWAECKALERLTHDGYSLLEAARCFRRTSFLALGGYNPRLEAGEDWDLQIRCRLSGLSTGKVTSRILHDEGNPTLLSMMKKKYRYGRTLEEYLSSHPNYSMRQTNPVSRILVPGFRIVRLHPAHGIGVIIMKTMEFTSAAVGWFRESLTREDTDMSRLALVVLFTAS